MQLNSATNAQIVTAFSPVARASGTVTSSAIDTLGFQEMVIVTDVGVVSTNAAVKVTDCDTSGGIYADVTGAAFTTVAAAGVEYARIKLTPVTTGTGDKCDRFVKISMTTTGAGNSNIGVYVILLNYTQGTAFTANTYKFNID